MPGLTDAQVASAYPTYYGQIVVSKDVEAKEPGGRGYTKIGIKPYGSADGSELLVPGETGLLWTTIFYKPEDITNPGRDIHKYILGLKAMKVPDGDTNQSVGFEGWFRQQAPQNGYNRPTLPVPTPRINGKSVPVPPRPEDWDLQTWLDEHSRDDEDAADAEASSGIDVTDQSNVTVLVAAAAGNTRSGAVKNLLAGQLASYGVSDMQAALDKLVESGTLSFDGKNFGAVNA